MRTTITQPPVFRKYSSFTRQNKQQDHNIDILNSNNAKSVVLRNNVKIKKIPAYFCRDILHNKINRARAQTNKARIVMIIFVFLVHLNSESDNQHR